MGMGNNGVVTCKLCTLFTYVMHGRGLCYILPDAKSCYIYFLENDVLTPLVAKASARALEAFRPKTRRAYGSMFRVFVAFCIYSGVILVDVNVKIHSVIFGMFSPKSMFMCYD